MAKSSFKSSHLTRSASKSDWRIPFQELQRNLFHIYDANLSIHHAVALSTSRSRKELQRPLTMLEPAVSSGKLIREISVSTPGALFHAHLYFADDRRGIDQFQRCLSGIEHWCDELPPRMIPGFDIPRFANQGDRDLVRWTSLVYYLARATRAPYLTCELEFQQHAEQIGFFPWIECPQPPECLLLPGLIHHGTTRDQIERFKQKFDEYGERFPDLIDAFLIGDFVA